MLPRSPKWSLFAVAWILLYFVSFPLRQWYGFTLHLETNEEEDLNLHHSWVWLAVGQLGFDHTQLWCHCFTESKMPRPQDDLLRGSYSLCFCLDILTYNISCVQKLWQFEFGTRRGTKSLSLELVSYEGWTMKSICVCVYKSGGDSSCLPLLNEYLGAKIHQDQ